MKLILICALLIVCSLTPPNSASFALALQNVELDLVSRLGYGEFHNLVYDPDKGVAYIASASGLLLWDQKQPDILTDLLEVAEGGVSYVTSLNPAKQTLLLGLPNGSILAYSVDDQQTDELTSVRQFIRSISVSYDETYLAIDGDNRDILLFNLRTLELSTLPDTLRAPSMFSPTEPLLIASSDTGLIRWDYRQNTQSEVAVPNLNDFIMKTEFSEDGRRFAIAIRDGTIHVWNSDSIQLIHTISPLSCCVDSLHFDSSGTHIIATYFSVGVVSWSLETLEIDFSFPTTGLVDFAVIPGTWDVILLRFNGDLKYWSEGSEEPSVEIINPMGISNQLETIGSQVISLAYEFDSDEIMFRPVDQQEKSERLQLPDYEMIIDVAIAPNGTELAYYAQPEGHPRNIAYVRRLDLSSKTLIEQYTLALHAVYDLQYDTLSNRVAVAGQFLNRNGMAEGQIVIVSNDESEPVVVSYKGMGGVLSIDWLDDNAKLVSTHVNGMIVLWDVSMQSPTEFTQVPAMATAHAVSQDGTALAVITYTNTVHVFNLNDLTSIIEISLDSELYTVGVSAEYRLVVVGSRDGSLRGYDFDGTPVFDLKAHSGQIEAIVFSGSYLVTSSLDYTTKIWQIRAS